MMHVRREFVFCRSVSWPHSPSLIHSSFSLWAAFPYQASWKSAAACEQPLPIFSSEILRASHGSWYLSLAFRHAPLSETAGSKCHPFPFIHSLSEFAQVTCFSAAAVQSRKHRRILHGRSVSTAERLHSSLKPQSWTRSPWKRSMETKGWQVEQLLFARSNCSHFLVKEKKGPEDDSLNYAFIKSTLTLLCLGHRKKSWSLTSWCLQSRKKDCQKSTESTLQWNK